MKKSCIKLILNVLFPAICFCNYSKAQVVNEQVTFDNYISPTNNDFVNNFNNGIGLSQITTNGIVGGCLTTPTTESWGNDNAIYCSKYLNAPTNLSSTRISFKYDTTLINTVNFDRSVTIYLRPSADYNHYIIASLMHDKKLQIITYGWVNNMPVMNLLHNHWYEFNLRTSILATFPSVYTEAEVFDLGTSGLVTPVSIGSSFGTFSDSIFYDDPAVEVSVSATQWGGAKYVDIFSFEGVKSADSCTATSVATLAEIHPVIYIENGKLRITNCDHPVKIDLFAIDGRLIFTSGFSEEQKICDISRFRQGIYLVRVSNDNIDIRRKLFFPGN